MFVCVCVCVCVWKYKEIRLFSFPSHSKITLCEHFYDRHNNCTWLTGKWSIFLDSFDELVEEEGRKLHSNFLVWNSTKWPKNKEKKNKILQIVLDTWRWRRLLEAIHMKCDDSINHIPRIQMIDSYVIHYYRIIWSIKSIKENEYRRVRATMEYGWTVFN